MSNEENFASPVDTVRWGEYRINRPPHDSRPLYRFGDRIGSDALPARAGRYHVYAGWFCPWAQRVTIGIAQNGLADVVSVSYVDDVRDGRGWAFREQHGPDPVNGFTLLRQAYAATETGFDGHISVPALWDRESGQVVSNDYRLIGLDVATAFGQWADPDHQTYPASLRPEIDELDRWLGPAVNQGVAVAGADGEARSALLNAFTDLDQHLADRRYLVGDQITEADIRLWVTLVRYDAQANAGGRIGPSLPEYPALWAYARDLYAEPAFRGTTRFASFTVAGAVLPDWSTPSERRNPITSLERSA